MAEKETHLYGKKELNKQQIIERELKEAYYAPKQKFDRECFQVCKEKFLKRHADKIIAIINNFTNYYLQAGNNDYDYDHAKNIATVFPDIFQNIDKYNLDSFTKRHNDDSSSPLYDYSNRYDLDDFAYDKIANYLSLAFIKENFEKKGEHYYAVDSHLLIDSNTYGMKTYDYDSNTFIAGNAKSLESMMKMYANQLRDTIAVLFELNEQQRQIFVSNEKMQQIFTNIITADKLSRQLHLKSQQIVHALGLDQNDALADYQYFLENPQVAEQLIDIAGENEVEQVGGIYYGYAKHCQKNVILPADANERAYFLQDITKETKAHLANKLAYDAAQEKDEQFTKVFNQHSCERGYKSPYYYSCHQLYQFMDKIGPHAADEILYQDSRNIGEQLKASEKLASMGFDLSSFNPKDLEKQIQQVINLENSRLFAYMEKNYPPIPITNQPRYLQAGILRKQQRVNFAKAKKMYYLAKQVFLHTPISEQENFTRRNLELPLHERTRSFYLNDYDINWQIYDTQDEVSAELLNKHLHDSQAILLKILAANKTRLIDNTANVSNLINALEAAVDLNGLLIADDQNKYLQELMQAKADNREIDSLELAISLLDDEKRQVLNKQELDIFYQNFTDYLSICPDGLEKLAHSKINHREEWQKLLDLSVNTQAELNFSLSFSQQTGEVQTWCGQLANYIGGKQCRDYILRFNATFLDNGVANWHDALYWVDNLNNLSATEIKSILSNINSVDENNIFKTLITKYSRKLDKNPAPINSLRELKARVVALESNIDLSKLPDSVLTITAAPGFSMAELEKFIKNPHYMELIEGKYDLTQPFTAQKRSYPTIPLAQTLREALGSRKNNIAGTAANPQRLFSQVQKLLKTHQQQYGEKLSLDNLLQNVPSTVETAIVDLLKEHQVDPGLFIEAQVHNKSDPEGWVCGNYTDCCMPFGSSKNYDYMLNPGTQYFTVKINDRIIAQSVMVDAIDNKKDNNKVIILDNIEVAHGYTKYSPAIANCYSQFFSEYTSLPVKIGTGYSDLIPTGAKLESNNYHSTHPLSYSDARGSQIYDLPKIEGILPPEETISFANLSKHDIATIANIEKQVYPPEMVQGREIIQEVIDKQIEADLPGAAASFIVQKGKETAGYMLLCLEPSEINSQEQVAHIYDWAILPKFNSYQLVTKMLNRVLEAADNYQLAIEAETRESTTYKALKRPGMTKYLANKGFIIAHEHQLEKYLGGENFYYVRLEKRPISN